MREKFKASDRSCQLRFHTQTAGCSLTAQQIDNNIVRVAYQALSAVLGGTQSLHTNARDEALALPTEASARIALRTQQILANETGVTDTVDPLAGSYFLESLTDRIEEEAMTLIEKIEGMGGAVKGIEKGFQQQYIQNSAFEYQKKIEEEKLILVGVNRFQIEEPQPEILRITKELEEKQIKRLKNIRKKRDNEAVSKARERLKKGAEGNQNLLPLILDAVRCYTTLGEISNTLREVFGEYRENVVL